MTILQRAQKLAERNKPDGNADAVRRILNWLASDDDSVAKCLGITRVLNRIPSDADRSAVLALVEDIA